MNNKLYFFIGLPRSGKSTIAKEWQRYGIDILNHKMYHTGRTYALWGDNPRIVVNADAIRLALHGQAFIAEAEKMVHTIKELMIKTYLLMGYDVLVDGTHTKMEHIDDLLYIRRDAEYLLVDTDMNICKQRAIDTNQQYLFAPIERMAANLQLLKDTYLNETKS
jgi:adenylylsulfate kinase-like enzyme